MKSVKHQKQAEKVGLIAVGVGLLLYFQGYESAPAVMAVFAYLNWAIARVEDRLEETRPGSDRQSSGR